MKTLFINARILDIRNGKIMSGNVLINGNRIAYVGQFIPKEVVDRTINAEGNLLMPGFINCHAHTAMTLLRGLKDDVSLQDWLFDNVLKAEEKLSEEDIFYATYLGIMEYLKAGITSFDDFYFNAKPIIDAICETEIRARVNIDGEVGGSRKAGGITQSLKNTLDYLETKNKKGLIKPVCTAHSIYTLTEEHLGEFVSFAKQNKLPLAIHLSETLQEVGDCTVKYKMTPPQYLESLGFFDRECLAFHCVHMDKDDLDILANYNVSVATCPSSNIKLASGIAPIYAMQNKGLNICIGTDGPASNNGLDMFKEMFLVATLSKVNIYNSSVVSALEVLQMATLNGAKALGIEAGEIAEGKLADIILVNTHGLHMQPIANLLSHLVYSAKSSDVLLTMVNGKILYEEGKLMLPKSENVIKEQINLRYNQLMKEIK